MAFRGASEDAVADLTEMLQRRVAEGADAAALGSDLFALAAVIRQEPGLRRVATDVSVSGEAKAGLVRDVFGGKVGAEALDVLSAAVGARWAATRHLADALEHLGVVATVRSADREGAAGRLVDELFGIAGLIKDNPGLRDALSDTSRSAADKRDLVRGLLEGRALPATVRLVEQALAGTHRTVGVALGEYQKVAAEVHGEHLAVVRVAQPLDEAGRRRLADALARRYDRPVHLNVVVEPDLIGGLRVEIGDEVIDGTVVSRLEDVRRRLAS